MSDQRREEVPAFPMQNTNDGMDLRDYFAARVLEQMVARGNYEPDYVVNIAYRLADAMMIRRKR